MTIEELFFINVIKLMPYNTTCYLQAPDLPKTIILKVLQDTEFPYYKAVDLGVDNNKLLTSAISNESITETIQSLEIKSKEALLFEGYDGMEYGIISKNILLPDEFIKKFIEQEEMCKISTDW